MLKYLKQILPAAALCATFAAMPLARAGGVIIDGSVAKGQATGSAPTEESSRKSAGEREQQIYLFVAAVLNGPVIYVEETGSTTPNPGTISAIVDHVGSEQSAGCAGAPSSLLAAFAGLGLLRRRRR